jgi:hypothetical protein
MTLWCAIWARGVRVKGVTPVSQKAPGGLVRKLPGKWRRNE